MDFIKIYIKGIGTIEGDPDDIERLDAYLDDAAAYNKALTELYLMQGNGQLYEDHLDSYREITKLSDRIKGLILGGKL